MSMEQELKRYEIEKVEKWREWCQKIPSIHFKTEWEVKVIPPFGGALTRFVVDYNGRHISVYLDVFSRLGFMYEGEHPIPYFEAYPIDGDCRRYYLNEVDEMIEDIERELNKESEAQVNE